MIVDELVQKVSEIPVKTSYWFVRTDDGKYFDTFYKNGFIGIGWNNITLEEIKNEISSDKLRNKIIKSENFDEINPKTKGKVTTILNKLEHFVNLKRGDVVIIPSRHSSRLAFGIVDSDFTEVDISKSHECDFYKRRKINWVAVKNMQQLDPHFYKMKISRHTISKIDDYSVFVDNVINSLYRKNNYTHFVIDITSENDINVIPLVNLIQNIQFLIEEINKEFLLGEEIDKNSIRLNLQSPGKIEFKLPVGKSLIILATILSHVSCNNVDAIGIKDKKLGQFAEVHSDTLSEVKGSMDELEVDKDKINSFQYGSK